MNFCIKLHRNPLKLGKITLLLAVLTLSSLHFVLLSTQKKYYVQNITKAKIGSKPANVKNTELNNIYNKSRYEDNNNIIVNISTHAYGHDFILLYTNNFHNSEKLNVKYVHIHKLKDLKCELDLMKNYENRLHFECGNAAGNRSKDLVVVNVCPDINRPRVQDIDHRNKYWQAQQYTTTDDDESRMFAMHAYYDDRPIFNGSVYIRLFVVKNAREITIKHSQCYMWVDWLDVPIVTSVQVTTLNGIRLVEVNNKTYDNVIVSCKVPDIFVQRTGSQELSLMYVSLLPGKCGQSSLYIPVTYPEKPKTWEHTFGMCEANGVSFGYYGDEMAPWLIEWMEASLMFGITELNIYNATLQVSNKTQRVLDYYQRKGTLILHHQPPPITNYQHNDRNVADIGMRIALNDCLYRNMYRYKYTAVLDLDEIFVPQVHDNYHSLFNTKENASLPFTQSYMVIGKAFFKTFTGEDVIFKDSKYPLKSTQYRYYSADIRMKSFLNPRTCLGAFSHYCLQKIVTTPEIYRNMNLGLLRVHHYRDTCVKPGTKMTYESCEQRENDKEYSDRMLYFQDKLYLRIELIKKEIGL